MSYTEFILGLTLGLIGWDISRSWATRSLVGTVLDSSGSRASAWPLGQSGSAVRDGIPPAANLTHSTGPR